MNIKRFTIVLSVAAVLIFLIYNVVTTVCTDRSEKCETNAPPANPDPAMVQPVENPASRTQCVLDSLQLVNVHDVDSTILVELKYATIDNFTGKILYEDLYEAYLQPDVALMLAEAHRRLKQSNPSLRLLVYDAVRPLSIQQEMWEHVKDTKYHRYVADPEKAGLHNFAAAIDLTLADSLRQPLDMGTPFDHFGRAAGAANEQELVEQGLLTEQQVRNRQLLRQVMHHAGFLSISGEWWHFSACSLQEAKQRYRLVERL